jgi:hypothetical protein
VFPIMVAPPLAGGARYIVRVKTWGRYILANNLHVYEAGPTDLGDLGCNRCVCMPVVTLLGPGCIWPCAPLLWVRVVTLWLLSPFSKALIRPCAEHVRLLATSTVGSPQCVFEAFDSTLVTGRHLGYSICRPAPAASRQAPHMILSPSVCRPPCVLGVLFHSGGTYSAGVDAVFTVEVVDDMVVPNTYR